MSKEVYYLVTGEKFLPGGKIEKIKSAYTWSQFMSAQSLIERCLIDGSYSKMQIEIIVDHEAEGDQT